MTSTGWSDLMATALVGTSRRPWSPGGSPFVPAGVEPGEAGLLTSAGAVALARRAGAVATTGVEVPPPAPADDRPPASAAAVLRLEALLAVDDEEHLGLWLRLAVTHGRTVPGRLLPELFRRARQHTSMRADLTVVAGARGAWLAAQRDDWRALLGTSPAPDPNDALDESVWSHGTAPDRVAYLAGVRHRDPDRARELLAEAWPTESPADRAALLAVLGDGIGPADEELCEKARADGRVAVRRQAVSLLARIPDSAYRRRMADRAASYVAFGPDGITVTPPTACDAEMKRDDIDPKPPAGTGERAFWTEQVIGAAPLSTWDGDPTALVALPVADEWAPVLHRAWARAAAVQRDAAWATALLGAGYGRGDAVDIVDATIAAALHDQLDPATALAWVREALAGGPANHTDLARLIAACPQPLPADLVRPLLDHLREQAVANRSYYVSPRLRELAVTIAAGLPLDAVRDVVRLATEHAEAATDKQQALVNVMTTVSDHVSTRHQMIQEFS